MIIVQFSTCIFAETKFGEFFFLEILSEQFSAVVC